MERRRLINVALGREPADVIVAGGQVLSVHTGEILRADVAIVGSRIAAVGELPSATRGPRTRVVDAAGLFISPGLIDGHLHYHHTYLDPAEASKLLLRNGITGTADGFYACQLALSGEPGRPRPPSRRRPTRYPASRSLAPRAHSKPAPRPRITASGNAGCWQTH